MTTEELQDWFEQTAKIITDLHICLNNANRLFELKYENEDKIKNHGFFRHHYYQLWFIMSIQLSKLLTNSKNQKYNFNKLFDRLEREELDANILNLLAQNKNKRFTAVFKDKNQMIEKIDFFRKEIKNNETTIAKFKASRDTLYAHRDKDAKPQNLTLKDAEHLIYLCRDIYNCFRGGIFDVNFEFTRTYDWSIDYILKQSAYAYTNKIRKR
jgi:hypothetical protein